MRWLARRLVWSVVVVWAVASVAFVVDQLLPGDPARMVAGAQARPADVARIRAQLGLDEPAVVQYARFWRRLVHVGPRTIDPKADPAHGTCAPLLAVGASALHLDFGKSFMKHAPVVGLVAARLPRTLVLALAGLGLQLAFGVLTGAIAACRRGTRLDRWVVGTSVLGISAPTFLIGLALQLLFARALGWLPIDGFGTTLGDHVRGLVLPALTLGIYGAAYYTRLVRDEMIMALRQDWARTARAKGLPPWRVVIVHGLRNALLPVVTAAGLDFGALMGGAVVTETVFRWPGMGELSVQALLNRDGPVILATVIVTSTAVVGANLVTDIVCSRLARGASSG